MEYALVNGIRSLPKKEVRATCTGCGGDMIAKCGEINVNHWAHKSKVDCDPWWEKETQWHRDWKNLFPEDYREVVLFNDNKSEHHRADIFTKTGVTIEFQNSPLSLEELRRREGFYNNLIWVLNGEKFKGFQVSFAIPDPNDPALKGYEIVAGVDPKYFSTDQRFWPKRLKDLHDLCRPHSSSIKMSPWHDSFIWKYKHKAWLQATCPVLVDLGGNFLYRIKNRKQETEDFFYLKKIVKQEFIDRYISL